MSRGPQSPHLARNKGCALRPWQPSLRRLVVVACRHEAPSELAQQAASEPATQVGRQAGIGGAEGKRDGGKEKEALPPARRSKGDTETYRESDT